MKTRIEKYLFTSIVQNLSLRNTNGITILKRHNLFLNIMKFYNPSLKVHLYRVKNVYFL